MTSNTKFPGQPIAVYYNMQVKIDNRFFRFKTVKLLKYDDVRELKERMLFFSVEPPSPILNTLSSLRDGIHTIFLYTPKGRIRLDGISIYHTTINFIIFAGAETK